MSSHHAHRISSCDKPGVTIDILPNDVLLIIFYFDGPEDGIRPHYPSWHRLVHVCRRWRSLVFASPKFLDLRLIFDPWAHVELADIWPPLPIIIMNTDQLPMPDLDAAIAYRDRIRQIDLSLSGPELQRLIPAMQEPFPALMHLRLACGNAEIADGFLGGSAPRLRSLELKSTSFPAIPKFLLSATDLVSLNLWGIPYSGYISPETLVTSLAALTNLQSLTLNSTSSLQSHPDWGRRYPLPPTRTVLPSLIRFLFVWVSDYLEDLVARIDVPLLDSASILFFYEYTFDIHQFGQFLKRTRRFQALNEAHIEFGPDSVHVAPLPPMWVSGRSPGFQCSCLISKWTLSSLPQILASFFPSLYVVEHLYIYGPPQLLASFGELIESVQWLEILKPFTAAKKLYLPKEIAQCIASALQELVGERVARVLPALESIFLEDLESSGHEKGSTLILMSSLNILSHQCSASPSSPTTPTSRYFLRSLFDIRDIGFSIC